MRKLLCLLIDKGSHLLGQNLSINNILSSFIRLVPGPAVNPIGVRVPFFMKLMNVKLTLQVSVRGFSQNGLTQVQAELNRQYGFSDISVIVSYSILIATF